MPVGTCDPASRGDSYNEGSLAIEGVVVTYRYGWDGTSTRDVEPGCVGPLLYLSGTNTSTTTTYYAHFQGRRGTWRRVELAPGQTVTEDRPQRLSQQGFATNQDVEGLYITADPTPPTYALTKR